MGHTARCTNGQHATGNANVAGKRINAENRKLARVASKIENGAMRYRFVLSPGVWKVWPRLAGVWQASGRRLDVWASGRLGHVWSASGSRLGTSRASGLVPRAHDVWARLGTSGHV
eukprot:922256-Prymnesium_polylepis.1